MSEDEAGKKPDEPEVSPEALEIPKTVPDVVSPAMKAEKRAKEELRDVPCPLWILKEALTYVDSMQVHPNVPGGSFRKFANALEAVVEKAQPKE